MRLRIASIALVSLVFAASACGKKKDASAPKAGEASGSASGEGSSSGSSGSGDSSGAAPASGSDQPAPAAGGSGAQAAPKPAAQQDLVATAKAAGSFNTLVKAIDAAGLTQTLSTGGPYTVFAPTDEAFAKLAPKDLDALLADKAKLTALIQYHVVPGAVSSKDLSALKQAKTVEGAPLAIDTSSGVKVGTASVVKADVVASNGVIHAIDTVQLPPQ
jgi:uncharacterized surface protein with fasciclin (FAS1) repeats